MPDPTAIRLASEARRADLADELYSSVVEMHNLIDKAYQDERAAHRATIEQLARAGADQGADLDACRFLGCSAADLLATVTSLYETRGGLVAEVADLRAKFAAVEKRDAEWRKATGCANPDGWHIVSDRANEAKVAAAESARDAARGHVREVTRQRDEAWSALNQIADRLRVVHENPKIVAAVAALIERAESAESESHRVAVAAAEVTAERDALEARVAALEAVVKAAASTLHVYVGEDFEVCRVCGIEDAKADHVDLDAYARGRDAADPVTVPAPDRAEELIIAQYDGCRKVAAELGHDGNWYAWGEWCRVNPNARSIQVEAMRRAIVGLAHGRAASPPPDASGPASDAELTALWSKTGGSVTASNRALYNHGVAYGRAKAATVPVGVAPDMDRVNMISALHAAAFDHGVACGRGKDPTEHQRREGDALDKLMAAFAYPAAKMPAGDTEDRAVEAFRCGWVEGVESVGTDGAALDRAVAAYFPEVTEATKAPVPVSPLPTPSPRYVAVKRDEVNGRPASWFHTEAEAGRYVALCNDNPDLFGADDEIEGALESYTHAVVDTCATPPAALPQVEAFGLPAVEWTRDEDNDTDPDDETSHTAWRPGDGIRSEYASTWFEAGAVGWSLLLDGTAPDEPTARARVEAAVALLTGRAEVRR